MSEKKLIDPKRKRHAYLLFCENEGGIYKVFRDFSTEEWVALERNGYFDLNTGLGMERIYPAYASLVVEVDNRDFRIDEINGTRQEPAVRTQRFTRSFDK